MGLVSRKLPVRVPVRHTRGWASLSLHSAVSSSQGAKTTKSWNQNEKPLPLPVILSGFYTSWQRTNVYKVQLEDHKAKEGRKGNKLLTGALHPQLFFLIENQCNMKNISASPVKLLLSVFSSVFWGAFAQCVF